MTTTAKKPNAIAGLAGIITIVIGAVFIIAGSATWGVVSSQLKAENITIPGDARWFAGQEVRGPLTAYSQADIINTHSLNWTPAEDAEYAEGFDLSGMTYAELGAEARNWDADSAEAEAATAQRASVMNGSFLRASLFTSVVAYGVSALVIGLGVTLLLVGYTLHQVVRVPAIAAPAKE